MSKLFALFQYLLPQHLLSRLAGVFAERKFAKNILLLLPFEFNSFQKVKGEIAGIHPSMKQVAPPMCQGACL